MSAPSCLSQSSGSKGTWTCRRGVSGRIFEGTQPHPPGQAEGGHDRGAVEQRGEQESRHDVQTVHLAAWGRLGLTEEEDTGDGAHLEPGHEGGVAAHRVQLRAVPRPGPAHLVSYLVGIMCPV